MRLLPEPRAGGPLARALLMMLSLWALACSAHKSESYSSAPESYELDEAYGGYADAAYPMESKAEMSRGDMPSAPPPAPMMAQGMAATGPGAHPVASAPPQEPAPAQPRMMHYAGRLELRVNDPEGALGEAAAFAEGMGGYVENLSRNTVVLRVPVARFEEALAALEALGDVLSRSISARDVTDAYADTQLRLRSHKAARERLLLLLAEAKTEREKLMLLREIQRLTDEIELLQSQAELLKDLADLSRITVAVQPRLAPGSGGEAPDLEAFSWISSLSPSDTQPWVGKRLELEAPAGMVQLPGRGPWVCEGPDGTVHWATRLSNEPQGDSAFWLAALKRRLAEGFDEVSTFGVGAFEMLRLEQVQGKPYIWYVGVRADGKHLDLVHVYFPSPEAEQRFKAALLEALSAGGAS